MKQPIFSVSQVNAYISQLFVKDTVLRTISVKGEVSNCKYHSSGHLYFSIKDRLGQLSCVMFASACRSLSFALQEGMNVIVRGSMRVYERDGKYQLYAEQVEKDGIGDLYEQMELLKQKLLAEGLFSAERKKMIPKYAGKIAIVTAKTGAAIMDIVQIANRRNPYVKLSLFPAQVQGIGAAESICRALKRAEHFSPDIIIVGRGGGSIEDLSAFNEESVVRAVACCGIPIISAVGHETDVSLSDYAADLRAPTPSAAAELAVFDYQEFQQDLIAYHSEFTHYVLRKLTENKHRMQHYAEKLSLLSPAGRVREKKKQLSVLRDQLNVRMNRFLTRDRHRLQLLAGRLHAESPAARLQGGYAYLSMKGKPVHSVSQLSIGDPFSAVLKDGEVQATVLRIDCNEKMK